MEKATKEEGITLIALIITIIIMLILVGVTVSVALNGGLFKTASDAAKGTDKARIEEEMTSVVLGFVNENLLADANVADLKSELLKIKGITSVDGENFPITVKDENGNEWTIDSKGRVKEKYKDIEKVISAEDPEASYWKTDGNGTILYYEPAEGAEVPETLIVPCQIGNEKIIRIEDWALTAIKVERNEDGSYIEDPGNSSEEFSVPVFIDDIDATDENGLPIELTAPTNKVKNVIISKGIEEIRSWYVLLLY